MRFGDKLRTLLGLATIKDGDWDDLVDLLVEGDLGAAFAESAVTRLKAVCAAAGVRTGDGARAALKGILAEYAKPVRMEPEPGRLHVFLLLGVNGVGKTTTAAKLARRWIGSGSSAKAILAAGDTFRAAAIEQLKEHGQRLGIKVVAQERGSDAAAVLFDALESAAADGADLVIADTAGRMHTKVNLIRELEKIDRIVESKAAGAIYRRLLVVDATTGQNALSQARAFSEAVKVDGIALTKYDSSAKGGAALAIYRELGIPCAFVCDGERYEDVRPFEPESYLDEFLGLAP